MITTALSLFAFIAGLAAGLGIASYIAVVRDHYRTDDHEMIERSPL